MLKWDVSKEEALTIHLIAQRAYIMAHEFEIGRTAMDITATHRNGCRLRLQDLLKAKRGDFLHDISGIVHHLDHKTGKLGDCFSPRFHA